MPPTVALIFMLSLLTFRLLTTVIHELGHAIPALLLTKDKVTVYMGSHGDPEKSFQFQIGRLECFFKFNLFYWKGGLCVMHQKEISVRKSFIVTASGPLLSLFVAGVTTLLIYSRDFNNVTTLVLFALIFSCTLDFLNNIFPNRNTIQLHDGTITHNDGMQLMTLWKFRKAYQKYQVGIHLMDTEEFSAAAEMFEEALAHGDNEETFYRLAIYSYTSAKNYEKARVLHNKFAEKHEGILDGVDYINFGIIQSYDKEHEKAIVTYTKALEMMPNNAIAFNNRGYEYGLLDRHSEAIEDLDKAIEFDKHFAFAWDNRGFSKIMLGQLEDGLLDIEMALELDDENAYAYRNVGLYYFYKKEYEKALELYEKALEMDKSVYKIQEYITEVKAKI